MSTKLLQDNETNSVALVWPDMKNIEKYKNDLKDFYRDFINLLLQYNIKVFLVKERSILFTTTNNITDTLEKLTNSMCEAYKNYPLLCKRNERNNCGFRAFPNISIKYFSVIKIGKHFFKIKV